MSWKSSLPWNKRRPAKAEATMVEFAPLSMDFEATVAAKWKGASPENVVGALVVDHSGIGLDYVAELEEACWAAECAYAVSIS